MPLGPLKALGEARMPAASGIEAAVVRACATGVGVVARGGEGAGWGWAPAAAGASAPFPYQVTQSRQTEDVRPRRGRAPPPHPGRYARPHRTATLRRRHTTATPTGQNPAPQALAPQAKIRPRM
ncbi:hypothetical protein GCM10010233_49620 [Streptomyces pseudogriseolus]|nr:hypothetical protein GCM10010233_49620 [Streptomyces gancidicus]